MTWMERAHKPPNERYHCTAYDLVDGHSGILCTVYGPSPLLPFFHLGTGTWKNFDSLAPAQRHAIKKSIAAIVRTIKEDTVSLAELRTELRKMDTQGESEGAKPDSH